MRSIPLGLEFLDTTALIVFVVVGILIWALQGKIK